MHSSYSPTDGDLSTLLTRVERQRQHRERARDLRRDFHRLSHIPQLIQSFVLSFPQRCVLHIVVGLFVSIATIIGAAPVAFGPGTAQQDVSPWVIGEALPGSVVPIIPLSVNIYADGDGPVPDAAFAEIDALPVSPFTPALLAVHPVPATIIAEQAHVRNGPGTEYDSVAALNSGVSLRLLARAGDWYKAQLEDEQIIWVASEVLATDTVAADFLPEATNIPLPPPAKIGLVMEEGLNLRDGPSTVYVGMSKLPVGTQLDLLARYQDWFQIQAPDGQIGWVTGEYLTIGEGIVERVESVTQIPDPNPPLVGVVRGSQVNLRGGPGTAYAKVDILGADIQLGLIAQHKDWFKVRAPDGAEGWVSSELVDAQQFVIRRVPQARNIPALPKIQRAAPQVQADIGIHAPIQFASASTTSGPAQFALQFVGSRYAWGGGSPESGFDCSGFTKYVYAQFGIGLPHSSAGQYSTNYGAAITNPADLQPGDIVFFVNTYRRGISHVGIYVGGGDVVQALTPGRGVGVANLNQEYWSSRYYGAIRPHS